MAMIPMELADDIISVLFTGTDTVSAAGASGLFGYKSVTVTQSGTSYDLTKYNLLGVEGVAAGQTYCFIKAFDAQSATKTITVMNPTTASQTVYPSMYCQYQKI